MKTFTAIRLSVATLIGAGPVTAARRKLVRMLAVVGFAMSMFACAGQQVATPPPAPPVQSRPAPAPAPRPTPPPQATPAPQPQQPLTQEEYSMRRMEAVCTLVGGYAEVAVMGRDKGYPERVMLQGLLDELSKLDRATEDERTFVRTLTQGMVSGIYSNPTLTKFNAKSRAQVGCITAGYR